MVKIESITQKKMDWVTMDPTSVQETAIEAHYMRWASTVGNTPDMTVWWSRFVPENVVLYQPGHDKHFITLRAYKSGFIAWPATASKKNAFFSYSVDESAKVVILHAHSEKDFLVVPSQDSYNI